MMRHLLIALLLFFPSDGARPDPWVMMATEAGGLALDGVEEQPGNPFATAFIELLEDRELTLDKLGPSLRARTQRISGGFQIPEIVRGSGGEAVRLGKPAPGERRTALVLVNAAYVGVLPPLPGAAFDASRVHAALQRAGFETRTVLDATRTDREAALRDFARASADADVALIYTTGHGVMAGDDAFLLDIDYPAVRDEDALRDHAATITELTKSLQGRAVNLLFFGGCREDFWGR